MNKNTIDRQLPIAYEALKECKIAENNTILKTFRGQISTFGAAATTGSVSSAIAFFSDKGGASVNREYLINAIEYVLKQDKKIIFDAKNLFEYSQKHNSKEDIINAAIALKLAMNLYELSSSET